jgi:lysophospholipase L1-like esterase
MEADAATRVDDFLPSGDHVCVCFGGTNDRYNGTAIATVQNRFQTYCESRQASGWKVVAVTMLPRSDAGTPAGFETDRQTFNTWLRANYTNFADALADVAADTRIGDSGDELDSTYYSADQVHPKTAGYTVIAEIVGAAVLSLFPADSVSPDLLHSNLLRSHLLTGLAR